MNERKRSSMSALVAKWEASGLTQTAFCRQESIHLHTFNYWKVKLSKEQEPEEPTGFVPLDFIKSPAQGHIEVFYPDGTRLHLPSSTPADYLKALLT